MRKPIFGKAAAGVLALLITATGCSSNGNDPAAAADENGNAGTAGGKLVVTSFGGAIEETQREYIKQFEEEYNAKVEVVTLYSADALARIRAEKNNPTLDVVLFSGGQEQIAAKEDLIEKIDPDQMDNLGDLYPDALNADGYAPYFGYEALGIIYNHEAIPAAPTSWKDLWKDEYKGQVGLVDISNTYGNQFLVAAARMNGGGEDNIQPGLDAIKELLPNTAAIVKSSPEVGNLFAQDEAWIAPFDSGYAYTFGKQGVPISFALPEEGAVGIYMTAQVVKGSPNSELARKYVDFLLRPDIQVKTAEGGGYSPTNSKTELTDELKAILPYGEETFNGLTRLDLELVNNNKAEWMEEWSKLITQ
ncbi:ABC transporter substrate-binding protein [Paenibacillus tengchongensis]|uniref:ABC transporter substrate-binding protein n=1 Tax=Paenibacillus tengchongensis TaxID=2608684 RepID=UPI001651DF09|nr:ABC transporter substrate-binding protein [Paenibacillus tengchongensis]